MPDQREDLPVHAGTGGDVLGFTLEELFKELNGVFRNAPPRQPGDLSVQQLMERFNCSDETVRFRMRPLVKAHKWQILNVLDENGEKIRVYRKVAKKEETPQSR